MGIASRARGGESFIENIREKSEHFFQIIELYPHFEEYLLEYWPKKDCPARLVKCHEKIELLVVNNEPLFFKQRDGPWLPNLHVLHRFPFMLPIQIVDKGAIKFILSGAHIMCPGITSPGAFLNHDTPKGTPVQVSYSEPTQSSF